MWSDWLRFLQYADIDIHFLSFQMIFSETFALNAIAYQRERESPIQRIVFKVQMLAFIVILITGIRLHRFPTKNFYHLQWNFISAKEMKMNSFRKLSFNMLKRVYYFYLVLYHFGVFSQMGKCRVFSPVGCFSFEYINLFFHLRYLQRALFSNITLTTHRTF